QCDRPDDEDAGVVHEHVGRAELVQGGGQRRQPVFFEGDVEMDVPARRPDAFSGGLAFVVEDVADHHARTLGYEQLGFGSALTASTTGDQCNFAFEPSPHDWPYAALMWRPSRWPSSAPLSKRMRYRRQFMPLATST